MTISSRIRPAMLALGLTGVLVAPAEAQWRRLDTPNFVVIGDTSTGRLRDVALEFEGFRETLVRILGPRATASAIPTVVYVFPDQTALDPFRPRYNGKRVDVGGLAIQGRDFNLMAVIDDDRPQRLRTIFHEYTHLLVANSERTIPLWLNEGLAEYYSTYEAIKGGKEATIGKVIEEHLDDLNHTTLIPLDELLAMNDNSPLYNEGSRRSVFYAQSWALTHMLLLGEPNRTAKFDEYVNRVSVGASSAEAWKATFGDDDVQNAVSQYIRRLEYKNFRFTFPDSVAKVTTTSSTVNQAETQAFQALLLIALDEFDAVDGRVAQMKKLNPGSPMLPVIAARVSHRQGQSVDAASLRMLTTPSDWFFAYVAGVAMVDAAESPTGAVNSEDVAVARRLLSASWAGREPMLNATARLAGLELGQPGGPTPETVAAFVIARERAPHRYQYASLYVQILVAQKNYAQARDVLGPFIGGAYAANVRTHARTLMGYVVNVEAQSARNGSPPPAPFPGMPPPSDTSSVARPVYRDLQAGEEQVDGVLTQIECAQGKGVTFHVKVGDQDVTATSAKLTDVDLITYRDDLRGNVQCGPLAAPMPVLMTWKKGTDAGVKVAVAIEFKPKSGGSAAGPAGNGPGPTIVQPGDVAPGQSSRYNP